MAASAARHECMRLQASLPEYQLPDVCSAPHAVLLQGPVSLGRWPLHALGGHEAHVRPCMGGAVVSPTVKKTGRECN